MYKQGFKCWRIPWRALGPRWCLQRHVHVLKDILKQESRGQAIKKTWALPFNVFCTCNPNPPTSSPGSRATEIKMLPLLWQWAIAPEAKRLLQGQLRISAFSLMLDRKLVSFTFPRCCIPCISPSAAEVTPGRVLLGTASARQWASSRALPNSIGTYIPTYG